MIKVNMILNYIIIGIGWFSLFHLPCPFFSLSLYAFFLSLSLSSKSFPLCSSARRNADVCALKVRQKRYKTEMVHLSSQSRSGHKWSTRQLGLSYLVFKFHFQILGNETSGASRVNIFTPDIGESIYTCVLIFTRAF